MKVADVMQRSVITVTPFDTIKDVARIIFSLGINGVPVIEGKTLVGIVTEDDIFKKLHPALSNLKDEPTKSSLDVTEKGIKDVLESPVKKIMSEDVQSIPYDTPIIEAQTKMLFHHFSRLPVVNTKKELVGIISQGDIFREIIRNEIPQIERERFAAFIAQTYDSSIDWNKRVSVEFPPLFKVFEKYGVENVIGLGSWTGQYLTELVNNGVKNVVGLQHIPSMKEFAEKKLKKMPENRAKRLRFILTDFEDMESKLKENYDAILASGNSLPYVPIHISKLFKNLVKKLRHKNAVVIIQLANFDKIIKKRDRLLSFRIVDGKGPHEKEHMYLEFLDANKKDGKLLQHVVIFYNDGKNWVFKGITSVPVFHYRKQDLEKELKAAGFGKITFTGNQGPFSILSSHEKFDPESSDWLNVIAVK